MLVWFSCYTCLFCLLNLCVYCLCCLGCIVSGCLVLDLIVFVFRLSLLDLYVLLVYLVFACGWLLGSFGLVV